MELLVVICQIDDKPLMFHRESTFILYAVACIPCNPILTFAGYGEGIAVDILF